MSLPNVLTLWLSLSLVFLSLLSPIYSSLQDTSEVKIITCEAVFQLKSNLDVFHGVVIIYQEIISTFTRFIRKHKKKLYGPFFLWLGFTCLKAIQPLQGDSLLFTIQFPEIPGTRFIDLGRMKGWVDLGTTQWFWTQDSWIGNPAP